MHKKSIRSHYSKRLSNTIRAKTKAEMLLKKLQTPRINLMK